MKADGARAEQKLHRTGAIPDKCLLLSCYLAAVELLGAASCENQVGN